MADRSIDPTVQEVPELNEMLESLLLQAIETAQARLEDGEELVPFTSIVVGNSVFEETHTGDTDECFASAQDTVKNTDGALAYGFCYDGYIEADEGDLDCIIAEGGIPGEEAGIALALVYSINDDNQITFEEEVAFLGEAPNFLADAEAIEMVGEEFTEAVED